MNTEGIVNYPVVSRDQWLVERKNLLVREKALTRLRDELAHERRALPWVRIEQNYRFDTSAGQQTLADLFQGRRQLLVQHFMLAPGWEEGCASCSFMADHTDGMTVHLANRDVTMLAISRAPLAEIEQFRQRMGWHFTWVSSYGSSFNRDFGVTFTPEEIAQGERAYNYTQRPGEEMPGVSVFYKDDAGEQILPELAQLADHNDAYFFGGLSQAEQETLRNLLKKLTQIHQWQSVPVD